MFNSSLYLSLFNAFLEGKKPFLYISEEYDLKRSAFLSDLIEQMDQHKEYVYFRFSSDINFEDLIHQITDRFVIPVRSVNVDLQRQLEDQIDILKRMNQKIILFIEDAHHISMDKLMILLKLSAYCTSQGDFPVLRVVLLGRSALAKKLIQSNILPDHLKESVLSFSSDETEPLPKEPFHKKWQNIKNWILLKHVRLISLLMLVIFGFFLYWYEGRTPHSDVKGEKIVRTKPPKSHLMPKFEPANQDISSEFKEFLSYLKSIEAQVKHNWGVTHENPSTIHEKLPALPLPKPVSGGQK